MGGFDDHIAIMGDWMSPRTLFSSMMNDDALAKTTADSLSESKTGPLFPGFEGQGISGNPVPRQQIQASIDDYQAGNSNALVEPRGSSRGGLLERMAARAGFNAPRLNTENIKPADLSKNSEIPSPLTIPPGLSPTTLLDSPQLLSNSLVMPSPTTGKFLFGPTGNNWNSSFLTDAPDRGKENAFEYINTSSFSFKPVAESNSFPYFNSGNKSFPSCGVSVHSDVSMPRQNADPVKLHSQNVVSQFQQTNFSKSLPETNRGSNLSLDQIHNDVTGTDNSSPLDEPQEDDGDQRSSGDPNAGSGPAEDGYNWRKYGQKQVKGSEYPRSYYKCTHPNCPVKKKVERSHEGHITEIIYKGAHSHPKPPPNRRSALGSSNALGEMQLDPEQIGASANGDLIWSGMQKGNVGRASDWRSDNLEATSSAPLGLEYMNAGATLQASNGAQSGDGRDGSSTFSNNEEEDRVTHGSVSLGYDGEGDESESKRRKIETYASELSGASRTIREPRVVVQTTSEVDILDDGYRWRKYGQKVVKGNPNPRSYYKCTSAGCNVRKHVERACHDLKSVITTYEGKHNHDVPAARNSSHMHSGSSSTLATQRGPPIAAAAAPSSHILRPEPSQIHGSMSRFERPSLGSFGFPPGRPLLGPGPGFGFGVNQPGLASLGMAGFGPNQGKIPMLPVHAYLGHQPPRPMNDMSFMMPKGEPKLEPVTESNDNASAVYQQFMSRLPLGPHM